MSHRLSTHGAVQEATVAFALLAGVMSARGLAPPLLSWMWMILPKKLRVRFSFFSDPCSVLILHSMSPPCELRGVSLLVALSELINKTGNFGHAVHVIRYYNETIEVRFAGTMTSPSI